MARSDWNQNGNADTNHNLSTEQVYQGSSSLKVSDATVSSAEILSVSAADAPTEARIITHFYTTAGSAQFGVFMFRFQDMNNFYYVAGGYNNSTFVRFGKYVGGTHTQIAQYGYSVFNPGQWEGPVRISAWVDSGGDFRARVEENMDGSGYTPIASDLVDTDPSLTSGGGVGIGGDGNAGPTARTFYYDQTEVYY